MKQEASTNIIKKHTAYNYKRRRISDKFSVVFSEYVVKSLMFIINSGRNAAECTVLA